MKELNIILRGIRISIFVLHTLWVIRSILEIFKAEVVKGYDIFMYILITGAFFGTYILFSMLYEKTIPTSKRSDRILSRFVYMFETMLVTSGALILSVIIKRLFLS